MTQSGAACIRIEAFMAFTHCGWPLGFDERQNGQDICLRKSSPEPRHVTLISRWCVLHNTIHHNIEQYLV